MNKNELSKKKAERMASIEVALLAVLVILALMMFVLPSEMMLIAGIILIMGVILGIMSIIEGIRLYLKWERKKQLVGHLLFAGLMFLMPVLFLLV